jgi:hypothetical protein
MNVSDFKQRTHEKLEQFNRLLEQLYGLKIDWDASEDHLRFVYNHYMDRKKMFLKENSYSSADAEMGKIVLITEAIRVYLREIAPSRKKKSRRSK